VQFDAQCFSQVAMHHIEAAQNNRCFIADSSNGAAYGSMHANSFTTEIQFRANVSQPSNKNQGSF
jgi:hypothetical protein